MSVINKMLRDLDERARAPDAAATSLAVPLSVTRGTASVTALPVSRPRRGRRFGWVALVAVSLALVALGGAWWLGRLALTRNAAESQPLAAVLPAYTDATPTRTAQLPPAALAANAPAPAAGATDAVQLAVAPMPPAPPATVPARKATPSVTPMRDTGVAARTVPKNPPENSSASALLSQASAATAPTASPILQTSAAPPTAPAAATATAQPVPQLWQDAALDTVAQAQRLWASGARDAALDLLRAAMQVLERSHAAELATSGSVATLALVRELARMELAQGQPAAVLELLQRHERLMAGRSELWALRANAAQRAGQHAQASEAYKTALLIRPGEPRWMLGAAVSLAAQGQLAPAAELAEQARALEAVSPEVLAYLRQLGVPLRDR